MSWGTNHAQAAKDTIEKTARYASSAKAAVDRGDYAKAAKDLAQSAACARDAHDKIKKHAKAARDTALRNVLAEAAKDINECATAADNAKKYAKAARDAEMCAKAARDAEMWAKAARDAEMWAKAAADKIPECAMSDIKFYILSGDTNIMLTYAKAAKYDLIYSFTGRCFKEKLHPYLNPMIMPVVQTLLLLSSVLLIIADLMNLHEE